MPIFSFDLFAYAEAFDIYRRATMGTFRYSRPDESFIGAASTGTVDADFNANSLCNGRPGDPVKHTGGLTLTSYPTESVNVGVIALCNHNLSSDATAVVSGGCTGDMWTSEMPVNLIPLNPYELLATPVDVAPATGLVLTTTGSVVGEFWAGKIRTLERGIMIDADLAPPEGYQWEGVFGSVPPNDDGTEQRTLSGTAVVSDVGLAEVESWYRSTRRGKYPTLIIPFDGANDAWLVTFSYTVQIAWRHPTSATRSIYKIRFEFRELPRTRW